jgi:hypothetical protein
MLAVAVKPTVELRRVRHFHVRMVAKRRDPTDRRQKLTLYSNQGGQRGLGA